MPPDSGAEEIYSGEPRHVFDWLRALATAGSRGQLNAREMAVATFVALDGDGTTGRNAPVRDDRLQLELDVSRATVWRIFKRLCDNGWFVQTETPARPRTGGGKGRRARYRVSFPCAIAILGNDAEGVSLPHGTMRRADAEDPGTCLTDPGERVSSEAGTSLTRPPEGESVLRLTEPTSDGPTSTPGHLRASTTVRAREDAAPDDASPTFKARGAARAERAQRRPAAGQ